MAEHSTTRQRTRIRPTAVFADTAVLDKAQLAQALGVSERQVDRLDLPTVHLGTNTPRYVWRQVLATLEQRAA